MSGKHSARLCVRTGKVWSNLIGFAVNALEAISRESWFLQIRIVSLHVMCTAWWVYRLYFTHRPVFLDVLAEIVFRKPNNDNIQGKVGFSAKYS